MKKYLIYLLLLLAVPFTGEALYLKENLAKAEAGDFIVTSQNRNYTLLHIMSKSSDRLVIEEITVPAGRMPKNRYSWRSWVEAGAPYNSSWVVYRIHLGTGRLEEQYSFTHKRWCDVGEGNNFLATLLNLNLKPVEPRKRKRVGRSTRIWNPRMVVDGQRIDDVPFDAFRTRWPSDGTELSDKKIEVYLPEESDKYPSYFPYWLEISGFVGKAKVRIIDSGSGLSSPKVISQKG